MPSMYDEAGVNGRPRFDRGHSHNSSTSATYAGANKHFNPVLQGQPPATTDRKYVSRPVTPELAENTRGLNGIDRQDHAEDLPALQLQGPPDAADTYEPILEDEPGSYDLVAPPQDQQDYFSLEGQTLALFSKAHLQVIFSDPSLLLRFTAFISVHRPQSIPLLVYYLDALKAMRAIQYANAVTEALEPLQGFNFTAETVAPAKNAALEKRADEAFQTLVNEELPAYITHIYINIVSQSISRRITGTLAAHLREASEGLAEVFCLTDPARKDNPIVFSSEEFHRTTQYGMDYVLGRNCRFLQGPNTNQHSIRRLREAVAAGRQHQEVFLNYRRDGSPFVNLLMTAPLCDSRGKIRYFIGAQVDVSGLVKDCTDMESLQRLLDEENRDEHRPEEPQGIPNGLNPNLNGHDQPANHAAPTKDADELQNLAEMLNLGELSTVRRFGGRMHTGSTVDDAESAVSGHKPRLLLREPSPDQVLRNISAFEGGANGDIGAKLSGKLSGVYKHYLLVRPYPSLRILFASPSQRVPGILQSSFLSRIGGSPHVRDELEAALAEGRGVTAKIRWLSSVRSNGSNNTRGEEGRVIYDETSEQGRPRWIHCTPLVGSGGSIGVWMVVMVIPDEEQQQQQQLSMGGSNSRTTQPYGQGNGNGRMAPPVRMPQPSSSSPRSSRMFSEAAAGAAASNRRYTNGVENRSSRAPSIHGYANGDNARLGDISISSPHHQQQYQPHYTNGNGYAGSTGSGSDGERRFSLGSVGGESLSSLRI